MKLSNPKKRHSKTLGSKPAREGELQAGRGESSGSRTVELEFGGSRGKHATKSAHRKGGNCGCLQEDEDSTSAESDVDEIKYYGGGRRPPSPPLSERNAVMVYMHYGDQGKVITIGPHEPLKKVFDEFESRIKPISSEKISYLGVGQAAFLSPSSTVKEADLGDGGVISVRHGQVADLFSDKFFRLSPDDQRKPTTATAWKKPQQDKETEECQKLETAEGGSVVFFTSANWRGNSQGEKSDIGTGKDGNPPTIGYIQTYQLLLFLFSDQYFLSCFCCASRYCWDLYRFYPSRASLEEEDKELEKEKSRKTGKVKGNIFRSSLNFSKPQKNLPFIVPVVAWFQEDTLCGNPEKCTCVICLLLVAKENGKKQLHTDVEESLQESPSDASWRFMLHLQPDSMRAFVRRHGLSGNGTDKALLSQVRLAWDSVLDLATGDKPPDRESKKESHPPSKTKSPGVTPKQTKETGVIKGLDYSKWDSITDSDDESEGKVFDWSECDVEGWEILENAVEEPNAERSKKLKEMHTHFEAYDVVNSWSQFLITCNCCASRYYWDMRYYTSKGKAKHKKIEGGVRFPRSWLDVEKDPPENIPFVVEVKAWFAEEYLCGIPGSCQCGPCGLVGHSQLMSVLEHQKPVGANAWQWLSKIRHIRGREFWEWYWQYLECMNQLAEKAEQQIIHLGGDLEGLIRNLYAQILWEQIKKEFACRNVSTIGNIQRKAIRNEKKEKKNGKASSKNAAPKDAQLTLGLNPQKGENIAKKSLGKDATKNKLDEAERKSNSAQNGQKNERDSSPPEPSGGEKLTKLDTEGPLVKPVQRIDYSKWEHIHDSDEDEDVGHHYPCSCAQAVKGFKEASEEALPWDKKPDPEAWFKDFYASFQEVKGQILDKVRGDRSGVAKCRMIATIREHGGPELLLHVCHDLGVCLSNEHSDEKMMLMLVQHADPQALLECLPAAVVEKLHKVFGGTLDSSSSSSFSKAAPFFDFLRMATTDQSLCQNDENISGYVSYLKGSSMGRTTKKKESEMTSAGKIAKASIEVGRSGPHNGGDRTRSRKLANKVGKNIIVWDPLKCSLPTCGKEEQRPRQWKLCERCELASYCGRECQRQHWKFHKIECKAGATSCVAAKK